MSSIGRKRVDEYIDNVCGLIKNKKVHENIKDELLSHIDEIIEDCMEKGKIEDEAVNQALLQMGSYDVVGTSLNKVHKAEPDWVLLIMTSILTAFGIFTLGFMVKNNSVGGYYSSTSIVKTIICVVLGLIIGYGILKVDYRNFKKYSKYIYVGTIVISIVGLVISQTINGVTGWVSIGSGVFNIFQIIPLLFIISLAGIFENYNWNSIKNILLGFSLAFMPCVFFLFGNSLSNIIVYGIAVTTIMIVSGIKIRYIIAIGSTVGAFFAYYIFSAEYRVKRVFTFLNPAKDPEGSGWIYIKLNNLRESSGLFGKGGSIAADSLPSANTDFIFTYIIYSFGWIVAIILVSLVLAFIIRIGFISENAKDRYGKLIVSGLCALFAAQFLLNILINLNLFPAYSVSMPFISYSGTGMIINMFSIGLIASVHKWRNTPYKILENKKKIKMDSI